MAFRPHRICQLIYLCCSCLEPESYRFLLPSGVHQAKIVEAAYNTNGETITPYSGMASSSVEVKFAQNLAANEKKKRDKSLKKLRKFLRLKSSKKGDDCSSVSLISDSRVRQSLTAGLVLCYFSINMAL